MLLLVIAVIALVGYLALSEGYLRLREVCRLTYFVALLTFLFQYGGYFNSVIKEVIH
jgi:hypothetical protein